MIYLGNGIYSEAGPDTLAHYGVLGMRWGVRKAANQAIAREQQLSWARQRYYKKKYKSGQIDKPTYKKIKRRTIEDYRLRKANIKQGKRRSLASGSYDKKFADSSKNRYYTAFGKGIDEKDRRNQRLGNIGNVVGTAGYTARLLSQLGEQNDAKRAVYNLGTAAALGGTGMELVALKKHNNTMDANYNNNYDRKSKKKRR